MIPSWIKHWCHLPLFASLQSYAWKSTYFPLEVQLYKQVEGAPVGSPLSPVLADLYMEYWNDGHQNSPKPPSLCMVPIHGRHLCHTAPWTWISRRLPLQYQFPQIEHRVHHGDREGQKTPFLGCVGTEEGSGLMTTVYRKPTHTDH